MTPGPKAKFGALLLVVSFVVFSVALYAGANLVKEDGVAAEEGAAGDDAASAGGPVSVRLVARNLAFDKRSITASPGAEVTVTLDNQDAGVLHNVSFYQNRAATQVIYRSELFAGVAERTERFTAPARPGNFIFRCDAHPDTMSGSFIVK